MRYLRRDEWVFLKSLAKYCEIAPFIYLSRAVCDSAETPARLKGRAFSSRSVAHKVSSTEGPLKVESGRLRSGGRCTISAESVIRATSV
jgi:hypothetical protein